MQPALQALLLCIDDKVVRVLRRVLGELEIGIEHCMDADSAVHKLTRQRFEAVIVDCTTLDVASRILKGTQASPVNKRAITVAILDGQSSSEQKSLKSAFALGAHFVLFKPVSLDKTKTSFRAVKALMKRERRRHTRIPVEIPVDLHIEEGTTTERTITADLGESGMAVKPKNFKLPPAFRVRFSLPGTATEINCGGEIAWEARHLHGVRFRDLSLIAREELKAWIARQLSAGDADDPPVNCKLTDLSLNACYLQTESPFPVRTRLQLTMKVRKLELKVEGIVRVMHPGAGMGVEFTRSTAGETARVEEVIQTLMASEGAVPAIQVRPDAIDNSAKEFSAEHVAADEADPLLSLFRHRTDLSTDAFHDELRRQRGMAQHA